LAKNIDILISTINGEFLETPVDMTFTCGKLTYVGMANVRQYDANDCIVVRRLFTFLYNTNLFGTPSFSDVQDFTIYVNANCVPCSEEENCCAILFNGCYVRYNGKKIGYG